MAFVKALARPSPHLSVETLPVGTSLLCGTQPVSSVAHEVLPVVSLQSNFLPGPGGVASAAPAAIRKIPPMANPRSRFMQSPPLAFERDIAPQIALLTVPGPAYLRGVFTVNRLSRFSSHLGEQILRWATTMCDAVCQAPCRIASPVS